MKQRSWLGAVMLPAVIGLAAMQGAIANDKYPSRPIMLVSPYQAGGTTEVFARLLTEEMSAALGAPIVIEQKPGAGGTIGARQVALSKPDGYTLLANTSQHVMYQGMFRAPGFDSMRDFKPIGMLGSTPVMVVVGAASPLRSFQDVVQVAKQKNVTFASGSLGSLPHLAGELVASQGQLKMTHVPYNGTAPALTDVMGGHVDLLFSPAASAEPLIRSGKLRALAVTTKTRMDSFPDVPTVAESGMPGFDVTAWYGVWAPKNTPAEVVQAINDAMRKASNAPAVRKRMADLSVSPSAMSASEFEDFARRESALWLDVMKKAKLEPN